MVFPRKILQIDMLASTQRALILLCLQNYLHEYREANDRDLHLHNGAFYLSCSVLSTSQRSHEIIVEYIPSSKPRRKQGDQPTKLALCDIIIIAIITIIITVNM